MRNALFILFLLIILVTLVQVIKPCSYIRPIILRGKQPGPVTVLIAGIHGNEPAAIRMLWEFGAVANLKKGTIIVIPSANPCALIKKSRLLHDVDLNRQFLAEKDHATIHNLKQYINMSTCVVDFHESSNYYSHNPKKYGNAVFSINDNPRAKKLVHVANSLPQTVEWEHVGVNKPIPGSLFDYCNKNHIEYILVETCLKDHLNTRQNTCQAILLEVQKWHT